MTAVARTTAVSTTPAGWYGRSAGPRAPQGLPERLPASTYHRRQAIAAGLVVAVVLAVWVLLGALGGGPLPAPERDGLASSTQSIQGPVYVVQPGDTMWSIAARLHAEGDPRPLVDKLVAAHGGSTVHVGERIPLPVR